MIKNSKPPTINDVAALAGTSKRTVSRVINRSDKVNEATRERVQRIIDELNYSPNRQARGLAASRSYLIGLIYDLPTLFISDIQKGILSVCGDAGYELVVHACNFEADEMIDEVTRFVSRAKLDGVIILPPISEIDDLGKILNKMGVNFVRLASAIGEETLNHLVVSDYKPAIVEMTSQLVEFGHRDLAYIAGPRTNTSSRKRQEVFVQALARHGLQLSPDMVVEGDFSYDAGVKAAEKLLSLDRRPTAIFAANDEMAFGVMNVAYHKGLRIPRDFSLVGFDGTSFSTFVVPPLSTIIRQTDEMSRLGTQKLLAQIEGDADAATSMKTMVSTRFIDRESVGPVPSS